MSALRSSLAVFVFASHNPWTALPVLFVIGAAGSAVAPALQIRLMDVADDAQTLAAALNHSSLNIANATGAWLGGLVIAAGFGYTAPAAAGALLAVAGSRCSRCRWCCNAAVVECWLDARSCGRRRNGNPRSRARGSLV